MKIGEFTIVHVHTTDYQPTYLSTQTSECCDCSRPRTVRDEDPRLSVVNLDV